jgi:hypothetical protein
MGRLRLRLEIASTSCGVKTARAKFRDAGHHQRRWLTSPIVASRGAPAAR